MRDLKKKYSYCYKKKTTINLKVNNLQGKANAGAEVKKPNINKNFAIETSHGKIQMNTLNNEQSPQQNKASPYNVTSPQQLVNMELKKQDSSGSEVNLFCIK